jgi:hypothetical protein
MPADWLQKIAKQLKTDYACLILYAIPLRVLAQELNRKSGLYGLPPAPACAKVGLADGWTGRMAAWSNDWLA